MINTSRRLFLESLIVGTQASVSVDTNTNEKWKMFAKDFYNTGHNPVGIEISTKDNSRSIKYLSEKTISTTPIVDQNHIYVGTRSGGLYSLNTKENEVNWSHSTSGQVMSSPTLSNDTLFFGDTDGNFYGVSVDNERKWTFPTDGKIHSSPVVKDGIAYFVSYDGNLYAVSAGTEVWKVPVGGTGSSPALSGDTLVVGSKSRQGHVRAISTSGEEIWDRKFESGFGSSPAIQDNKVYIGGYDGYLYCFNLSTGETVWKYSTDESIASSPSVGDNIVVFGNDAGSVYGLNAINGEKIWSHNLDTKVWNSPALTQSIAYVGSDGGFTAFDLHSGEKLWEMGTGTGFASPSVTNRSLYIPSNGIYEVSKERGTASPTDDGEKTETAVTTDVPPTIFGIPVKITISVGAITLLGAIVKLAQWSNDED